MSKVICSICGTSFPDTEPQCPICGSVRPAESMPVEEEKPSGYTYVKGGRFSKSNVRKRNKTAAGKASSNDSEKPAFDGKRLGLIIVLVLLLLIVTFMIVYIINESSGEDKSKDKGSTSQKADVPCKGITPLINQYTLTRKGEILKLDIKLTPGNCTDEVRFFENTEGKVVSVNQKTGEITCVGNGEAVVTVKCGEYQAECRITVEIDDSLLPTEPEQTEPQPAVNVMLFYSMDNPVRFNFAKQQQVLYANGSVTARELTWVSENKNVADVDNNGTAHAVAEGQTTIYAKYDGVTVASCRVICEFKDLEVDNTQEGGDSVNMSDYHFGSIFGKLEPEGVDTYGTSLKVGDKIQFGLIHKTDRSKNIYFEWVRTNPDDIDQSVIASEDKKTIERVSEPNVPGSYCVFKATYEGKDYYLKVRFF